MNQHTTGSPPPQPTIVMSSAPRRGGRGGESGGTGGGGGKKIVLVAIIVIVLAAAAAIAWQVKRGQSAKAPSQPAAEQNATPAGTAWEGAWGRTDNVSGGLAVERSGNGFTVTAYDDKLAVVGTTSATASTTAPYTLTFTFPAGSSINGLPGPLECDLVATEPEGSALFTATTSNQTSISMPLKRVAALTPSSPLSSASPQANTEQKPDASSQAKAPNSSPTDSAIIEGALAIKKGITAWAEQHNGSYPEPSQVTSTGDVARFVDPWPSNPAAEGTKPMAQGTEAGTFTYQQLGGGKGYRLEVHLAGGTSCTLK